MSDLKENVLKLTKSEQYEIYEAIEANLFGESGGTEFTVEQMRFIEKRLSIVDSGKAHFVDPAELKLELDNLLK